VVSGRELATLRGHTSGITNFAFSPDGSRVASTDRATLRVWNVTPFQE
jgi:WD40 repeat protein